MKKIILLKYKDFDKKKATAEIPNTFWLPYYLTYNKVEHI